MQGWNFCRFIRAPNFSCGVFLNWFNDICSKLTDENLLYTNFFPEVVTLSIKSKSFWFSFNARIQQVLPWICVTTFSTTSSLLMRQQNEKGIKDLQGGGEKQIFFSGTKWIFVPFSLWCSRAFPVGRICSILNYPRALPPDTPQ